MARLGNYRVKHLHESEVSILSVTVAVQRDLVFGGYSDGSIAVWSMRATEAVLVLQGHQCDVTRLVLLACYMHVCPHGIWTPEAGHRQIAWIPLVARFSVFF
ncbi:unnamed protein product [Durusdinium trenchii]|uniref:Uncharacterized protein n=2 Tax=Durusdinium trenchii TaxID=1381693 RepID=A0ABP0RXI6_9DINO